MAKAPADIKSLARAQTTSPRLEGEIEMEFKRETLCFQKPKPTRPVSVQCPSALIDMIDVIARVNGVTRTSVVNAALEWPSRYWTTFAWATEQINSIA